MPILPLAMLPGEMGFSPFHQSLHDASQRLAMLTQGIFDPRRHPGEDRAGDDALTFKLTQLHREHVLAYSGDRSSQFVEAAWASQELPQDRHFPFPAKNRQCRVDLRGWLAERSGMATGLSHLFHTTPQKPSFLCAQCSRRYLSSSFTST